MLLFLHGGGYVSGSLDSHRGMVAEAGRLAGMRTLALGYRLAPEHAFPAALEDSIAGYRYLLSLGLDPRRIAIGGDSAGGGLTVATLVSLRDAGLPLPACAWCVSPWVDLEMTGDSIIGKAEADPMIQKELSRRVGGRISARRRSALAARVTPPCRSLRASTAADPGRVGRNVA